MGKQNAKSCYTNQLQAIQISGGPPPENSMWSWMVCVCLWITIPLAACSSFVPTLGPWGHTPCESGRSRRKTQRSFAARVGLPIHGTPSLQSLRGCARLTPSGRPGFPWPPRPAGRPLPCHIAPWETMPGSMCTLRVCPWLSPEESLLAHEVLAPMGA